MGRRTPDIQETEDRCYRATLRVLRRRGVPDPYDWCMHASVVLMECLRRRGVPAELVGREFPAGQGRHFTVKTPAGELDPTIAYWPRRADYHGQVTRPRDSVPGVLYRVTRGVSPHSKWRRVPVSADRAYGCMLPGLQRKRG